MLWMDKGRLGKGGGAVKIAINVKLIKNKNTFSQY